MKTTVRILTMAFALGLAGALTTAWGAQSVVDLISSGESAMATVRAAKAELDASTQKNHALAAEGQQIVAQQQQMKTDIAAFNQQEAQVKAETDAYEASCIKSKPKTQDAFKACQAQNAKINADIEAVNTQPAKLKARQSDWVTRATAYNQQVKDSPNQVRAADAKYRDALATQETWLDKARNLVASPAFQPYAKKAGCPNVMQSIKTLPEMAKMSDGVLACLKKVAGTS